MLADSPTLTARLRELHDLREGALAQVLAADTAATPGDRTPQAAAALLTAAHRTLFQQIMDLTLEDKDNQEIAAIVADTAHQVRPAGTGPDRLRRAYATAVTPTHEPSSRQVESHNSSPHERPGRCPGDLMVTVPRPQPRA